MARQQHFDGHGRKNQTGIQTGNQTGGLTAVAGLARNRRPGQG